MTPPTNIAPIAAVEDEPGFAWTRQLRPALAAIESGEESRALVVGIAGSGKSRVLRHLHRVLSDERRPASILDGAGLDPADLPPSHVLLVDDLHLLPPAQLSRVRARAEDPRAAIIATSRPWPWSPAASGVARELERSRPAIVLGHVSRSDVVALLATRDEALPDGCLDHVLEATGGVSWLVMEALAAHDTADCAGDPAHRELQRVLEERVAHRLDTVAPAVRSGLELLCLSPQRLSGSIERAQDRDAVVMQAFAEGLATRAGRPVPIVRACVRATIPAHRLIDLGTTLADAVASAPDADLATDLDWVARTRDPRVGDVLVAHADQLAGGRPERAAELYRHALDAGLAPAALAERRARAAWAAGDLDEAAALASTASADQADGLADVAAATWAGRGMMAQAAAVYRTGTPHPGTPPTAASLTSAAIARIGAGDPAPAAHDDLAAPTPLAVSMQLLHRGLTQSLQPGAGDAALDDLVRAAELFTSARAALPTPEAPAVLATLVALGVGDTERARTVLDDAIAGDHGGAGVRRRLLLWRAWVAVQAARPAEAQAALSQALHAGGRTTPRDDLLARTTRLALARRYQDAAGLELAWTQVRPALLRVDIDLYLLLPLSELVCSAAKVGDTDSTARPFAHALELVERLGAPPVWAAQLRWAGVQQGILRGRPDLLAPHARALVAAGRTDPVAATMAAAGRVWTAVLAGTVDPDAVESSAKALSDSGLRWDAARLAGHGAGRATDRRIAARLLACARELHPNDTTARAGEASAPTPPTAGEELLSERELDVARLVLQGKTYAEIGESIFISPRTAEHHIAHIRRRLGAGSRSEMIAKLRVLIDGDQQTQRAGKGVGDVSP